MNTLRILPQLCRQLWKAFDCGFGKGQWAKILRLFHQDSLGLGKWFHACSGLTVSAAAPGRGCLENNRAIHRRWLTRRVRLPIGSASRRLARGEAGSRAERTSVPRSSTEPGGVAGFWHPYRMHISYQTATGGLRAAPTPGYYLPTLRVGGNPQVQPHRLTLGLTGAAPITPGMQPRRPCGVQCRPLARRSRAHL